MNGVEFLPYCVLFLYLCKNLATALSIHTVLNHRKLNSRDGSSKLCSVLHETEPEPKILGKVVFLLPDNCNHVQSRFGTLSPCENPSIFQAVEQLCRKIEWFSDATIVSEILILSESVSNSNLETELMLVDALIAFNIKQENELNLIQRVFEARRQQKENYLCHFAFDCDDKLNPICGPYDSNAPSLSSSFLPWSLDATGRRIEEQMLGLFNRWTSDDFVVALMVYFNQFRGEISWVKHSIDATWEKGITRNVKEFYSMATKCGPCIIKCLQDEKCKSCLDALTAIDTRDQVASYRTIVSYESELLKDFTLCILQKNNIFGCSSSIPTRPKVEPMRTFRGTSLTQEIARSILIGHLDDDSALEGGKRMDISWKVAAGANVAVSHYIFLTLYSFIVYDAQRIPFIPEFSTISSLLKIKFSTRRQVAKICGMILCFASKLLMEEISGAKDTIEFETAPYLGPSSFLF